MNNETRNKIISAAQTVFAEKGFNRTSVRDICNLADVNIAMIKYYFKDKEGLYRELIQNFFEEKQKKFANTEKILIEKDPEKRLRFFLENVLNSLDPKGEDVWFQSIMKNEIFEPTLLSDLLFNKIIAKDILFLKSIYAELTGLTVKNIQVQQLAEITMSNCLFYTGNNHLFLRLHNGKHPNKEYFKVLIDTIFSISIKGAKSIRK